ncbi:hypothetical protein G6F59_017669 [Rhizopus arrhizus]|nr:hypothetical protein G6F59_017669 [Rhizopus arrhizus]
MPGFSPVASSYANAVNGVGTHRSRTRQGRSLILNGHIDVVPVGPRSQWSRDPNDPAIIDGWMPGRGAGGMKSGLIACMAALDALRRKSAPATARWPACSAATAPMPHSFPTRCCRR